MTFQIGQPEPTAEKFELYGKYQTHWHQKPAEENDYDGFVSFLYQSPVQTIEYTYRDPNGKLLGVGICDVCEQSLSSVYFYYDPTQAKRSLGVYSALIEIQQAKEMGIRYYYMGYWIKGCKTMDYKIQYQPSEVLEPDGRWVRWKPVF